MRRVAEAFYLAAIALWVGGTWVVGYLVVPTLFASLGDRQLAGMVAGKLFAGMGWAGLAAAAYLIFFLSVRWKRLAPRRSVFWLVLAAGALLAVGQFGIQPLMAQMKTDALPLDVMESAWRERFVFWHGVSSILYLVQSLLGLWLVVWSERGLR